MMHRLRNYFLTGLVIAAPLFLTIYFTLAFIDWLDSWVAPLIPTAFESFLPISVPGFGLIVALLVITLLGFLTANLVGRTLVAWGELWLARLPLIRNVYRGLKQLFETALSPTSKPFKTVVLIEFPRKGVWTIGFLLGEPKGEISEKLAARGMAQDLVTVFVPIAHITGFLAYIPREDVIVLELSPEEAAKSVISAGLVAPDQSSVEGDGKPISMAEAARRVRAADQVNRRESA
jgi:uncharacterized membrane protein